MLSTEAQRVYDDAYNATLDIDADNWAEAHQAAEEAIMASAYAEEYLAMKKKRQDAIDEEMEQIRKVGEAHRKGLI